jgi:serine/threonine protein kinase
MVETGRVIHGRYSLQRLLKQGQCCAVYQSSDQVLQRNVVIKIVPAEHIPAYRAAIRATSQFAHPNIIGIYDLIVEPDKLYIVQEYVEGEDFGALLQSQQSAYQVADIGMQICQALIYASGAARKTSHGDLTPSALIRDIRGQVRLNNFALPSDIYYFTGWSVVGGDGRVVSDRELAWGKMSDGRKEDDVRAAGLLMYQLLMSRTPGTAAVEPPSDGRLRFTRNVPPELCEVVARAVIRQHPQHITSAEELHKELKPIVEMLEPPIVAPPVPVHTQANELAGARVFSSTGPLGRTSGPLYEGGGQTGVGFPPYATGTLAGQGVAVETSGASDLSVELTAARQAAYPQEGLTRQSRGVNLPVLLAVGLVLFALFFVFGYFIAHAVIH